jgi:CHASE3 domain sensor protein
MDHQGREERGREADQAGSTLTSVLIIVVMALVVVVGLILLAIRG